MILGVSRAVKPYEPLLARRAGCPPEAADPQEHVPFIKQTWFYNDATPQETVKAVARAVLATWDHSTPDTAHPGNVNARGALPFICKRRVGASAQRWLRGETARMLRVSAAKVSEIKRSMAESVKAAAA